MARSSITVAPRMCWVDLCRHCRHLIDILSLDEVNPPLAAGEIVTTGTLTRALPASGGETWTTERTGVALNGICVRFA